MLLPALMLSQPLLSQSSQAHPAGRSGATPAQSATQAQPATSGQSATPVQPATSGQSATPVQPVAPARGTTRGMELLLKPDLFLQAPVSLSDTGGKRVSPLPERRERLVYLGYKEYMEMVLSSNLAYAAGKYDVSISEAQIQAARVFQDPTISFDWSGSNDEHGYSTEIEKSFEPGRRRARINLAQSEHLLAGEMLNDHLRNLRADATLDYLDAMRHERLYEVMVNSYEMLAGLARADSIRLSLGSIMAIDAAQSRLEAGMMYNELLQTEAERINSFITLSDRMSRHLADTLFSPTGSLARAEREYSLEGLIEAALAGRTDLMVAKHYIGYSKESLAMVRAERRAEISLKAGASGGGPGKGFVTSRPSEVSAGVAVPLKFSNLNRGEIRMAEYQVEQSELLYRQAEVEVSNEVMQAYNIYQAQVRQVANFDTGLLDQAREVLEGKAYSYSRGETSLLEVLDAQRTYNELQVSYYETLFSCSTALVELERSAGIWDITF